jgi:hypothetical protein
VGLDAHEGEEEGAGEHPEGRAAGGLGHRGGGA